MASTQAWIALQARLKRSSSAADKRGRSTSCSAAAEARKECSPPPSDRGGGLVSLSSAQVLYRSEQPSTRADLSVQGETRQPSTCWGHDYRVRRSRLAAEISRTQSNHGSRSQHSSHGHLKAVSPSIRNISSQSPREKKEGSRVRALSSCRGVCRTSRKCWRALLHDQSQSREAQSDERKVLRRAKPTEKPLVSATAGRSHGTPKACKTA